MHIGRTSSVAMAASMLGAPLAAQATPFLFTVMPTTGSSARFSGVG